MSQARTHSIADSLSGAFACARGLLSSILDLFNHEPRRAGLTLVLMLACGAIGAILAAAAWLGLMAALALWAVGLGTSWEAALAAVAIANLALAGVLFWLCAWVSRNLLFPAARRPLHPSPLKLV